MSSDYRERSDEKLSDRNLGDKRVPTPIVEGTGSFSGDSGLSHRGMDERDLTIGEKTNFQSSAVSPELAFVAGYKGIKSTLSKPIAEELKSNRKTRIKDNIPLEEKIAILSGDYKPQNINHGDRETRQSDLLLEEARALKSLTQELKRNKEEMDQSKEQNKPDEELRDTLFDYKDEPTMSSRNFDDELSTHLPHGDYHKVPHVRVGDDPSGNNKREGLPEGTFRPSILGDVLSRHGKYIEVDDIEDEIVEGDEVSAMGTLSRNVARRLKALSKAQKILKYTQTKFPTEKEIREEKHEAARKRKKEIMDKAIEDGIGTGWSRKLSRSEKTSKGKMTSWNRMDSGVRNEHRNTLGLSSISDFENLSSEDKKKVTGAGFWKENLKQQPIKEYTHFGDVGSTQKLEQEKKKPNKPKITTGEGFIRTRAGARKLKMACISTVLKIESADLDVERVSHTGSGLKPPPAVKKPRVSGQGGAFSKTKPSTLQTTKPPTATGEGKEFISSTSGTKAGGGNRGFTAGSGAYSNEENNHHEILKDPAKEPEWDSLTQRNKKPKKEETQRKRNVKDKLEKLRTQLDGFIWGRDEKKNPWKPQDSNTDAREAYQNLGNNSGNKKRQTPDMGGAPKDIKGKKSGKKQTNPSKLWANVGNNSGQNNNKKITYRRGNLRRDGVTENSAEENKERYERTRAGARGTKPNWKRTRAGER